MTSKAIKKQFWISVAVILIAVLSLTGATYAWLALNTEVYATGMKVTATTDGLNFEITNTWDSTADKPTFYPGKSEIEVQYDTTRGLIPIHPDDATFKAFNGTNYADVADWYHALSDQYDDAKVDIIGTSFSAIQWDVSKGYGYFWNDDGVEDPSEAFAMIVPFYVRLNPGSSGENVTLQNIKATNLKITDASGANNLLNCVYLLVSGPDGTYRITMPDTTDGESVLVSVPSESGALITELEPGLDNYKPINVIAFFDGRDEDCFSKNYDASEISISLTFIGTEVRH